MKMTEELMSKLEEIGFVIKDWTNTGMGYSVSVQPFKYVFLSMDTLDTVCVGTSGTRLNMEQANQFLDEMQKLMSVLNSK